MGGASAFFVFLWQEGGGQPVITSATEIVNDQEIELLQIQDFSLSVTTTNHSDTHLLVASSCDIKAK